jgi:hypothetical protein
VYLLPKGNVEKQKSLDTWNAMNEEEQKSPWVGVKKKSLETQA